MRTTVTLDDELLAAASAALGISERSVVLHEGLKLLVQRDAARRLAALGGSAPDLVIPPRRRPPVARRKARRTGRRVILVDTSVWVDHLRRGDADLARELGAGRVLMHRFVIGEIACGTFPRWSETLALLDGLPQAPVAGHQEALGFIDRHDLAGRGVGYIDMHLLASARIAGTALWTRDKRLAEAARELRVSLQGNRL